nr:MAG TPA: hypothetical protein [Bacteriophage sp.]
MIFLSEHLFVFCVSCFPVEIIIANIMHLYNWQNKQNNALICNTKLYKIYNALIN